MLFILVAIFLMGYNFAALLAIAIKVKVLLLAMKFKVSFMIFSSL